jgi:hypothetical protein
MQRLLLIVFAAAIFQSCDLLDSEKTWRNEHINFDTRMEIKRLDDVLFTAFVNRDVARVKSMLAPKCLEQDGDKIDTLVGTIHSIIQTAHYSVVDEYDVHCTKPGKTNTIESGKGDEDYTLSYLAMNKETYVSLMLPAGVGNNILILVVYGKYNDEWKINILYFDAYCCNYKTAPQCYKIAKDCYAKSYFIDAVEYMAMAKNCLKPGGVVFEYNKEKEISDYAERIMSEVNLMYHLPITLDSIDTKPKVAAITPQAAHDGVYPMVSYITSIKTSDTAALRKENEKIKPVVSRLFNGIDKDKKYVIYRALNKEPGGNISPKYFIFIDDADELSQP